jgi:virulence-associated protein VagC
MRWQTSAVLAVLLVLVGGFYYLYEVRWAPERERAESRKGRVFTAEAADVSALELRRPDNTVTATREGESWRLTAPVAARGNKGAIEETLTTILTAKMDREIEAKPASLADFGLDKPAAQVTLTLKDGKRVGLDLGAKSPTGVWVYAREHDKPAVFVLSDSVLREATRPVADFRDRTILAFERRDVTGVEIVTEGETIAIEPSGERWRITRPAARAADTTEMNDLLEKLATAKVKEFVAEAPSSRQAYGLERPLRLSVHTGKDKDRVTRTLLVGRADPEKKGVYAMRDGESSVLLLPEEVGRAIPRNVAAIRNKQLVDVERERVTRLEVETPKGAVTLVRDKDRWTITAPEALPADQVEAASLVTRLRDLRAQGFLSDDASAIPRVLAKPTVKVTVTEQGGRATTVLLAPSPERRGGQLSAYAAVAESGPVVLVEAKALDELGRSLNDLRDHALFAAVEPKDVKRVRVRVGGQTAVLERSGDSDWKLVEPTRGAARASRVEDVLYSVRALRWKDIVSPNGEDAARYGLDAPSMEVVFLKGDGGELARLTVGKRDGDRAYVRTGAGPTVYAIDARTLGPEPKVPDDFKA